MMKLKPTFICLISHSLGNFSQNQDKNLGPVMPCFSCGMSSPGYMLSNFMCVCVCVCVFSPFQLFKPMDCTLWH